MEAIEVDAAGEIAGVELDGVIACIDVAVHELGDSLAEGVVDRQEDVRALGEAVTDGCAGVEGVGVVLKHFHRSG